MLPALPPSTASARLPNRRRRLRLRPPAPVSRHRARAAARCPILGGGERFELDPQSFPTLCGLGKNLTLAAARGELDPVVGRSSEIEQALDVLAKREGNNPCLIGAAGVGKTSIVRGLAQRIADAADVASLDDRIVVEIPVTELLAGTGVRGALASRLGAIRREVLASGGRVVVFFDEIHQLFTGDAAEELASDLKLALAKGELPCIGATTRDDYKKSIESDPAMARRFSVVEIEEPSREDAFLILEALSHKLAAHHRVRYADDALALSVAWSVRYLAGRALPDKAVSIIDLAGARTRRRRGTEVTAEAIAEVVAELCGHAGRAPARNRRRTHAPPRRDPGRARGRPQPNRSARSRAFSGATPPGSAAAARSARSSCSDRPASARPKPRRRSPRSCFTTRAR